MEFKKYQVRGTLAEDVSDTQEVVDTMNLLSGNPLSSLLNIPPIQEGFRDGKYIHVSDLIGKCPRAIAIHYVHNRQLYGLTMNHQLGWTFSQGTAIAKYVEDHAIRTAPEHIFGGWQCACKKTEKLNATYDEVAELKCKICGTGLYRYKEVYLTNDEYMISGSIDITLKFGDLFYVNELKSLKKDGDDGFVALKSAKPVHRLQALFYVWLMIKSGRQVSRDFSVFYINKAYGFKMEDQRKEYKIRFSDYSSTLEPYLQDARDIKIAREGGALPKRPCDDVYCSQAKKCELAPICFNLEN